MIKQALASLCTTLILVSSSCQDRYPDLEDGLYAEFVTTKDTMVAKLFFEKVPVTVANFVALAEGTHPLVSEEFKGKHFYDSTTFHRVMDKFMIQGGDPTGTGSGSAGFKFEDEFNPELKHDKPGMLSMANSGFNSNGSQFFITEIATPFLDAFEEDGSLKNCENPRVSCHAIFGELVKGQNVQDSISNVQVTPRSNKPVEDVVILELNIIRKGAAAKKFDAAKVFTQELPKIKVQQEALKEVARIKAEDERILAEEKAKISRIEFLTKNEEVKGRRQEFPTGLAMIFLDEADNRMVPNSTQKVLINCSGYFENGELFYTTEAAVAKAAGNYSEDQDKGGGYQPFPMIYNETAQLVAGFREAMLNMKIGDKTRVFIPYYLGYGDQGRAPLIPPKTNLIFDIELIGIAE